MFLAEKDLTNFKQLESSQKEQKHTKQDKSAEQLSYTKKKSHHKKVRNLQKRISRLEKNIADIEEYQKELDLQFGFSDGRKLP